MALRKHYSYVLSSAQPLSHAYGVFVRGSPNMKHGSTEREHSSPELDHSSPVMPHSSPEIEGNSPEMEHSSPELEHGSPEMEHGGEVLALTHQHGSVGVEGPTLGHKLDVGVRHRTQGAS